jgi:hypothetical protein
MVVLQQRSGSIFANTSVAWKALDCDKDGNPNGTDPNPQSYSTE